MILMIPLISLKSLKALMMFGHGFKTIWIALKNGLIQKSTK